MSTPAGWYPDPQQQGQLRYWDGARWTEHQAPAQGAAPMGGDHGGSADAGQTSSGFGAVLLRSRTTLGSVQRQPRSSLVPAMARLRRLGQLTRPLRMGPVTRPCSTAPSPLDTGSPALGCRAMARLED